MNAPGEGNTVGDGGGALSRRGTSHWAGEPVPVLERRWGVPLVEAHRTLGSTNDRLRELAGEGAPPFTVVVAEEQTAGRGRTGRAWHSPPGGIWMSVLLPEERTGRPPLTPLLVGLAVGRAIGDARPVLDPRIKWPNDVLVDGRKVCGILCEGAAGAGTVTGIGINVAGSMKELPAELRSRTATLEEVGGAAPDRPLLAGRVLRQLRELLDPPPPRIDAELGAELKALDALAGRRVVTSEGVRGRGAGIAPDGALLVETDAGDRIRLVAGSVRLCAER